MNKTRNVRVVQYAAYVWAMAATTERAVIPPYDYHTPDALREPTLVRVHDVHVHVHAGT